MNECLYDVREVSNILRVDKGIVYCLIAEKKLGALNLGKLKVPKVILLKFLKTYHGDKVPEIEDIKKSIFQ